VDHHYKEVPLTHFKTNAMSYGKPWKDMWDEMVAKGFVKGAPKNKKKK